MKRKNGFSKKGQVYFQQGDAEAMLSFMGFRDKAQVIGCLSAIREYFEQECTTKFITDRHGLCLVENLPLFREG